MRALSAHDILGLWDWGQGRRLPVERSLALLSAACPELPAGQAASLGVGRRDARLLEARTRLFGTAIEAYVTCPECSEGVEFAFTTDDVCAGPLAGEEDGGSGYHVALSGHHIEFRMPNSDDMLAVAGCADIDAARDRLMQRCVLSVLRDDQPLMARDLPDAVKDGLVAQLARQDPQAEILIDVDCPACRHRWQALFDVTEFFWAEVTAQAKRLLREVHALARVYHWREADILAMSATRRQWYLEMLDR